MPLCDNDAAGFVALENVGVDGVVLGVGGICIHLVESICWVFDDGDAS